MPRFTTIKDIEDQLPYVDDHDVLRKAKSNPDLQLALEMSRPPNWWGTGLKPEQLLPIAGEGIPVAWVPSPVILKELVAAQPGKRIDLLMSRAEEIVSQCRLLLDECHVTSFTSFNDRKLLLLRALDTFEAAYHEAAMALAVVVAEGPAVWASRLYVGVLASVGVSSSTPGEYMQKIEKRIRDMTKNQRYRLAETELNSPILWHGFDVPRRALLAPVPRFFHSFQVDKGDPVPDALSRHAVVHEPTVEHFSRENALLAIMLGTSLLRAYEAHCDDIPESEDESS
jgi:hypothetical protein